MFKHLNRKQEKTVERALPPAGAYPLKIPLSTSEHVKQAKPYIRIIIPTHHETVAYTDPRGPEGKPLSRREATNARGAAM